MIQETITQIKARIQNAKSLNGAKKKELLDLVSTLKAEVPSSPGPTPNTPRVLLALLKFQFTRPYARRGIHNS